jgi:hypothetical protein
MTLQHAPPSLHNTKEKKFTDVWFLNTYLQLIIVTIVIHFALCFVVF